MNAIKPTLGLVVLLAGAGWATREANAAYTTITVQVKGAGTVWPNYSGRQLPIGSFITLRAVPAPGYIFAGWNDPESPFSNTFVVQPGLVLEADFVRNPFPGAAGYYRGLLYKPASVPPAPTGSFGFTLDPIGSLRGVLIFAGHADEFSVTAKDSLSQPIFENGELRGWSFTALFFRGDFWDGTLRMVMTAELRLDFASGRVTGTLSDERYWRGVNYPASWQVPMDGYRNGVKEYFTLVLAGAEGASGPKGAGFATVVVDILGKVKTSGFLADGTSILQRASISSAGMWPVSIRLYNSRGSLEGWLQTASLRDEGTAGRLRWSKPTMGTGNAAVPGFTNELEVLGSPYGRPVTGRVNFNRGILSFSGGGLASPFTNSFSAIAGGKFLNTSTNRMTLGIVPASGLFSGTITPPGSRVAFPFRGVLVQPANYGYGFFLGFKKESGLVWLCPLD